MQGDNVYSELRHSQHSLFKNFQEYLDIFRDIDAYSTTLTGVQLGGGGGVVSPGLFKNRKKCPDFRKRP